MNILDLDLKSNIKNLLSGIKTSTDNFSVPTYTDNYKQNFNSIMDKINSATEQYKTSKTNNNFERNHNQNHSINHNTNNNKVQLNKHTHENSTKEVNNNKSYLNKEDTNKEFSNNNAEKIESKNEKINSETTETKATNNKNQSNADNSETNSKDNSKTDISKDNGESSSEINNKETTVGSSQETTNTTNSETGESEIINQTTQDETFNTNNANADLQNTLTQDLAETTTELENTASANVAGEETIEATVSKSETENNTTTLSTEKEVNVNAFLPSDKNTTEKENVLSDTEEDNKVFTADEILLKTAIDNSSKSESNNTVGTFETKNINNTIEVGKAEVSQKVLANANETVVNNETTEIQDTKENNIEDTSAITQEGTESNIAETMEIVEDFAEIKIEKDNSRVAKRQDAETAIKNLFKELNAQVNSAATDGSMSNNTQSQQSAQDELIKITIEGLEQNIKGHDTKSINSVNFGKTITQTQTQTPKEISREQIIEQIFSKLQNAQQGSKMVITLNPESLGKVQVELVNSKNGLAAQMSVTNTLVKDILSKDLEGLKTALVSQGISVDNINIKVNDSFETTSKNDYLQQEKENKQEGQEFSRNREKEDEKQQKQQSFENIMGNVNKRK